MAIETITIKDASGIERQVAADQVSTAFWQVLKVAYGSDGAGTLVDDANPLPVTVADVSGVATQATLAAVLTELATKLEPVDIAALATAAKQDLAKAALDLLHTDLSGTLATAPASAGDVATTLTDGRKTVATPGTAVALRATLACRWVLATALESNTDQVNLGGSGVLAASGSSTGSPLMAGDSITIPVSDAASVFIDARVAGEGVSFTVGS